MRLTATTWYLRNVYKDVKTSFRKYGILVEWRFFCKLCMQDAFPYCSQSVYTAVPECILACLYVCEPGAQGRSDGGYIGIYPQISVREKILYGI